jgi:hypothetical protein
MISSPPEGSTMTMRRRDVAGALGAAVATALVFRSGKAEASKCGNIDSAIGSVNAAIASCNAAASDYGGEKAKALTDLNSALNHLKNCLKNPQC